MRKLLLVLTVALLSLVLQACTPMGEFASQSVSLPTPSPSPVPSPSPAPSPEPSPSPSPSPTPAPDPAAGFMIGQHFHRASNPIHHKYMFARTHDNESVQEGKMKWWTGNDTYDFAAMDAFRDMHKANNAKVLLTFFGTPTWASARPMENNRAYPSWPGGLAEPADLDSYGRMVQTTVGRYKDDLYAVECWNEPFADDYYGYDPATAEFFTGTPTALADMCKALYINTKAVSPSTPVICPAQAWHTPVVINAKTSANESILEYCDWLGWHPYGYTGVAGVGGVLSEIIDDINQWQSDAGGPVRPLIVTEWGVDYYPNSRTEFQALPDSLKAHVLYETLRVAREKGLKGFALYSYESDLVGINETNTVVGAGVTKAVDDFGGK